jgi:coenzyme F420-reducing hydrogenase alpha subunit
VHATLAYHWARMIEVLHAMEVIRTLLDDPDLLDGDRMPPARGRAGVGIIEAPRGTLIHHYRVGDDDLVTMCNLIVSTTHNNQAMNEAVRSVARRYLDGRELTEGLLNHIEVAIRAYDPCLSCATHALGQMPLVMHVFRDLHHAEPPPCTLLAIRGERFELGEAPTASALEHLALAVAWGREWLATGARHEHVEAAAHA